MSWVNVFSSAESRDGRRDGQTLLTRSNQSSRLHGGRRPSAARIDIPAHLNIVTHASMRGRDGAALDQVCLHREFGCPTGSFAVSMLPSRRFPAREHRRAACPALHRSLHARM